MVNTIETPEQNTEISESVRFYLSPYGSGRINMKIDLTAAIMEVFPVGKDLHATFNRKTKILAIKEM